MGLLDSDTSTPANDREAVSKILEGVCQYWDKYLRSKVKCSPEFTSKGVDRLCRFASEHIFTGRFFPAKPGPFKRAAALTMLVRHLECIRFTSTEGEVYITDEELIADYKAKFAFYCITPTLQNLVLDDSTEKLSKTWAPATNHLRAELIGWLKWLEAPLQQPDGLLDIARSCRAIMALSMIIEQSYYIATNDIDCDVMGKPCPLNGEDDTTFKELNADLANLTAFMNAFDSR